MPKWPIVSSHQQSPSDHHVPSRPFLARSQSYLRASAKESILLWREIPRLFGMSRIREKRRWRTEGCGDMYYIDDVHSIEIKYSAPSSHFIRSFQNKLFVVAFREFMGLSAARLLALTLTCVSSTGEDFKWNPHSCCGDKQWIVENAWRSSPSVTRYNDLS